jgi:hypothetical protein
MTNLIDQITDSMFYEAVAQLREQGRQSMLKATEDMLRKNRIDKLNRIHTIDDEYQQVRNEEPRRENWQEYLSTLLTRKTYIEAQLDQINMLLYSSLSLAMMDARREERKPLDDESEVA